MYCPTRNAVHETTISFVIIWVGTISSQIIPYFHSIYSSPLKNTANNSLQESKRSRKTAIFSYTCHYVRESSYSTMLRKMVITKVVTAKRERGDKKKIYIQLKYVLYRVINLRGTGNASLIRVISPFHRPYTKL